MHVKPLKSWEPKTAGFFFKPGFTSLVAIKTSC